MKWSIKLDVIKTAKRQTGGLSLFLVQRNEDYFLPFFFRHYRALGIENFLVYDDHSDDGSLEFLNSQPDCTILTSDVPYGQHFGPIKRLGNILKETVPDQFFPRQWVITADADEFLQLPPGFDTLPQFCAELDRRQYLCATAAMVDFYPARLSQRNHAMTVDPFAANPFFDVGPLYDWEPGALRPKMRSSGIRYRLMSMLHRRAPDQFWGIYGKSGLVALTFKVPLLKRALGVIPNGDHDLTLAPQLDLSLVFAHFKFYPGLDGKIARAIQKAQYWSGSLDYKMLKAAIELFNEETLVSPQSRIFLTPSSLLENGYFSLGGRH